MPASLRETGARAVNALPNSTAVATTVSRVVTTLVGFDSINSRLRALTDGANQSIISLLPRVPPPPALVGAEASDRALGTRGVKVRVICPDDIRRSEECINYIEGLTSLGIDYRTLQSVSLRAMVFDSSIVYIRADDQDGEPVGMFFDSASLAITIRELFDSLWIKAKPVTAPADWPNEIQMSIMSYLQIGSSLDEAAEGLGVSRSTVTRELRSLKRVVGATNLYALAVESERRGWANDTLRRIGIASDRLNEFHA